MRVVISEFESQQTGAAINLEVGWSSVQDPDVIYLNVFGSQGLAEMNPLRIAALLQCLPQPALADQDQMEVAPLRGEAREGLEQHPVVLQLVERRRVADDLRS